MHLDLTTVVIGLAIVIAMSLSFQLILLRRMGKLASARRSEPGTEMQDLAVAISQMLDEMSQLAASLDRKIGPGVSAKTIPVPQPRAAGVYGPGGTRKAISLDAGPRADDDTPVRVTPQTLDALLGATDRVVDKIEIARQAGVGVGEVDLWLRRHGGRSDSGKPAPIKVGA